MTKTQSSDSNRSVKDAEATKQQILDAAEEEFAKHGLNGARTEAIAKSAKVASRMIYYYFESKEGLYKAVLQRPATELKQAFEQLDVEQLPAVEALVTCVRGAIAYETTNRYRGMLLFQEACQNQGKYFQLTNWQDSINYVTKILQRGIAEGSFRQLDLEMTTLNIIGVCVFYANAHENLKHLTPDVELLHPEMIERYTQAAVNLVLGGVLNQPR